MKHSSLNRILIGASALAAVTAASAQEIRRNEVVPIRFEDTIRLSNVRVGDTFRARVDDDRDFPRGSILEGRVRNVRKPRDRENGYVEMEFYRLRTTNGRSYNISAVPVPLNDRYTSRDRNGRITVKPQNNNVNRGGAVLGGGLAGLAIGSLIGKQLEGAVVGVLGGILIAETSRSNNKDTIIERDARMGAAFTRDFRYDDTNDDRWDDRDDRWDRDNRDGRWDDRDDRNNRDPRYDRSRDRDNRDDRWDDRFDNYNPRIRYEDHELRFSGRERPYRLGNTAMLPLEETARQLGIRVEDRDSRTIRLNGSNTDARITLDSSLARIDGREVSLDRPIIERDGVLYAPAELFGRILRENFYVDGTPVYRRRSDN